MISFLCTCLCCWVTKKFTSKILTNVSIVTFLFLPFLSFPFLLLLLLLCIPFQTSDQGSGTVSGNQSNRNNFNYSESILTPPQTILLPGDIDFTDDTSNIHSTLDQRNCNNVICDTTMEAISSPSSGFVTTQSSTVDNNPTIYTNSNKQPPRSSLRNQPSYSTAVWISLRLSFRTSLPWSCW